MEPLHLSSGKVVLRPHVEADIDGVGQQCADPETRRWTTVPDPYTAADAERYVRESAPAGWAVGVRPSWAIADAADDGFLGTIDLELSPGGFGDLGFALHPAARGHGVMSAALAAVLDWAFDRDGGDLSIVSWRAFVGNWPSRRVVWSAGFRIEGTVRGLCQQRGARRDAWIGTLATDDPRTPVNPWYEAARLVVESVILRPFIPPDAEAVAEACSDPSTRHWLPDLPAPYTIDHADQYIGSREELHASGNGVCWAIADRYDRCVGSIALRIGAGRENAAELGYWVHPAARRRGVAGAACAAVVRHAGIPLADGGLGLRRLTLRSAASNTASRRLAESCGFVQTGIERQAVQLGDGTITDRVGYERLLTGL